MSPYRKAWIKYLLSVWLFITPISLGRFFGVTFSTGAFLVALGTALGAFLMGLTFANLAEEMLRKKKP